MSRPRDYGLVTNHGRCGYANIARAKCVGATLESVGAETDGACVTATDQKRDAKGVTWKHILPWTSHSSRSGRTTSPGPLPTQDHPSHDRLKRSSQQRFFFSHRVFSPPRASYV